MWVGRVPARARASGWAPVHARGEPAGYDRGVSYDPGVYWSEVARHVDARPAGGDWDLAGDDGPFHRYKRVLMLERLATIDVAGRSVLELGPGPGGNLRVLHEHGAGRLVGCDIAPEMVRLARRNLGDRADIHQLDGPALPLADRGIEVALTVTVLQHNPDETVVALLDELTRVAESTLELIEDTTTHRPRSWGSSYFVRDVNQYIAWVTARGFRLVDVQPIKVWASEQAWLAVHRLGRLAARHASSEGRTASRPEVAAERLLLSVTRRIDPRLPPLWGPTAMRFQRA
jgi:SAM-dependent methyltransferase